MKTSVCLACLALFGSAALAADPTTPPTKPPPCTTPPPAPLPNPAVTLNGKATVTIDVNGQKVTREVDLSNPQQFNVGDVWNNVGKIVHPNAGTEVRTWLGVATDEISEEVRAQLPVANGVGLLVREVIADSPAAKAGLQKNDVLTRLDDQILTNSDQLRTLVGMKKEGDTARLAYLRKGQEAVVEVKLATHAEQTYTGTTTITGTNTFTGDLTDPVRKLIFKTLAEMGNVDDPTFASRIYLDLLGRPPTADEIRTFVADPAPDKRTALVKRLLPADSNGAPIVIQRSAAFDKDGNVFWTIQGQPGGGKDVEQWHLYFNGARADVTEAMKKLEKSLYDAGLNDEAIGKTRQAVAEAIGQMQKAVSDANGSKDEIQRRAQRAIEEVRRAIENAWRSEEGEASKLPQTPQSK